MPSVWIVLDGYRRYSKARSLQKHRCVSTDCDSAEDAIEICSLFADVVGVAVARNETAQDDLSHAVHHPGGGTTLRAVGTLLSASDASEQPTEGDKPYCPVSHFWAMTGQALPLARPRWRNCSL